MLGPCIVTPNAPRTAAVAFSTSVVYLACYELYIIHFINIETEKGPSAYFLIILYSKRYLCVLYNQRPSPLEISP